MLLVGIRSNPNAIIFSRVKVGRDNLQTTSSKGKMSQVLVNVTKSVRNSKFNERLRVFLCREKSAVSPRLVRSVLTPLFARSQSTSHSLNLSGIFPPIATPFTKDEEISYKDLEKNLNIWNEVPFAGYVVQGSNGEVVYLSAEERVSLVKFVKEKASANKLTVVGSGCESTKETIVMTQKMADVGADAALVTTPCFYKSRMNHQAMMQHYSRVADASPIPIILYNVPSNTGLEFPLNSIIELSQHPNIIGMKDSGGDITKIGNIIERTPEDFQMIAGSVGFLLPSLALGAVGGVCALANVLGQEVCQLYSLYMEGRIKEATALQLKLIEPNSAVTRKYNVPALKYAMDLVGLYGGPCRSPMTPLLDTEAKDVRDTFLPYLK